jgi:hypothetical protein
MSKRARSRTIAIACTPLTTRLMMTCCSWIRSPRTGGKSAAGSLRIAALCRDASWRASARYDGGERLVYFMRNRCVHLSERGHTRDVGERSLRGLQCVLHLSGRSDIHQCADELLARFVDMTMGSNMNLFDVPIGHQQTILEFAFAADRAVDLLLNELAIIGMSALQYQPEGRPDRFIKSHDPKVSFRPDVVSNPVPADYFSRLVAMWNAAHEVPAIFAVGSPHALFQLKQHGWARQAASTSGRSTGWIATPQRCPRRPV